MTREDAVLLFESLVLNDSLRRHCRSVEMVMEAYAEKLGENMDDWAIAGLLHDADYEKFPDRHPDIIVQLLLEKGEEEIAHAISAHHTHWGKSYNTLLDKYLLASDELTGFIIAVSLMRPTKVEGLTPASVIKRLKTKNFAAGVDRDEIEKGIHMAGLDKEEHISFIIDVLFRNREALNLV